MSVTDDVKARLDIVDVVSDTVTLRKSGRNYIGFCPFHSNTKTPSFVVFPETQTWRCFGACADGGDLFSFVMRREGVDFKDALELLAKRAGIEVKTTDHSESAQQEAYRHKLLEINVAAASYFHQLLTKSPAAAGTRAYLARREITPETIAVFQLGYALDEWEALRSHLTGRGYAPADLLNAGLLIERDGVPGYDRFRHRLMIPIRDGRGQVIGFGARALTDSQVPKYLNSPQTSLFDKSKVLYGLDLARQPIRQTDEVVIVEGYMDVIQAHQRGAINVVAQMGTALTEAQLKRLAPLAKRIVLALDADTAGNAATIRSLSVARQTLPQKPVATLTSRGTVAYEGHIAQDIFIAALPDGKDPDDILREGLPVWQQLVAQAIPGLDFYENLVIKGADLTTPAGKSLVVRELLPVYREIKDNIERAARVQQLARKIGLDERLLLAELKGEQPTPRRQNRRQLPAPVIPQIFREPEVPAALVQKRVSGLEEYCLSLILAHPAALAAGNEILEAAGVPGLSISDFQWGDNREIFKVLQLWTALESPRLDDLVESIGETLEPWLAVLAGQGYRRPAMPQENMAQDLSAAVLRLRLQTVVEQSGQLEILLHNAESGHDLEQAQRYRETISRLSRQRHTLHDTLDALSLTGKRRMEARHYGEAV